jgi:hypothetical protein
LKLGNNKQVQIPSSSEIEDKLQDNDDIEYLPKSSSTDLFINLIERVIFQKWYTEVQIVVIFRICHLCLIKQQFQKYILCLLLFLLQCTIFEKSSCQLCLEKFL